MTDLDFATKLNKILLPLSKSLYVPASTSDNTELNFSVLSEALKAFQELGFKPSLQLLEAIEKMEYSQFVQWFLHTCKLLEDQAGYSIKNAKVFYQNFPQQVIDTSEAELYVNAIRHYFDNDNTPSFEREEDQHIVLHHYPELTTLVLSDQEQTEEFMINVLNSKLSWGEEEVNIIKFAFQNDFSQSLLPHIDSMKNHENKAHLWAFAVQKKLESLRTELEKTFNANDVIRAFAALSGFSPALLPHIQDTSVSNKIKFISVPNRTRKFFLSVIEKDNFAQTTMAKHQGLWKKIGEKIHPGDFAKKYPKAFNDFKTLRNNKLEKENSKIEQHLNNKQIVEAIQLLQTRPGEFVRRLDHILRISSPSQQEQVLNTLKTASTQVSTPVLWQAHSHFKNRNDIQVRAIMPKGSVSKMQVLPAAEHKFDQKTLDQVCTILKEAILQQYSSKDFLSQNNYQIDKTLFDIKVPNALRNSQSGLLTVGRGSRVPLPKNGGKEVKIVRLFTHWKNTLDSRVDVDLSANMYDKDFNVLSQVWYGNLKNKAFTHSGDVVDAPEGASEFIDVDIEKALAAYKGARYVGISVTSYTGQNFISIPECFAGVQVRSSGMEGQIFEPKTVIHQFDVNTDGRNTTPLLFDLHSKELIWVDVNINSQAGACQNVKTFSSSQAMIMKGILDYTAASLGEVIEANLQAQNKQYTIVENIDTEKQSSLISWQGENAISSQEILGTWL